MLVLIYVDDILITGSHSKHIESVIQNLNSEFALKDLGEFNYFLGVEVTPTLEGLYLSQTKYIGDILRKANMLDSKGYNTPMNIYDKLHKDKRVVFDKPSLYRSIIRSLQYVLITRHDIAFIVNKLSQFLAALTVHHWQACKRALRYLQCTAHLLSNSSTQGHNLSLLFLMLIGVLTLMTGNPLEDIVSIWAIILSLGLPKSSILFQSPPQSLNIEL